jgi:hypothetical protein
MSHLLEPKDYNEYLDAQAALRRSDLTTEQRRSFDETLGRMAQLASLKEQLLDAQEQFGGRQQFGGQYKKGRRHSRHSSGGGSHRSSGKTTPLRYEDDDFDFPEPMGPPYSMFGPPGQGAGGKSSGKSPGRQDKGRGKGKGGGKGKDKDKDKGKGGSSQDRDRSRSERPVYNPQNQARQQPTVVASVTGGAGKASGGKGGGGRRGQSRPPHGGK